MAREAPTAPYHLRVLLPWLKRQHSCLHHLLRPAVLAAAAPMMDRHMARAPRGAGRACSLPACGGPIPGSGSSHPPESSLALPVPSVARDRLTTEPDSQPDPLPPAWLLIRPSAARPVRATLAGCSGGRGRSYGQAAGTPGRALPGAGRPWGRSGQGSRPAPDRCRPVRESSPHQVPLPPATEAAACSAQRRPGPVWSPGTPPKRRCIPPCAGRADLAQGPPQRSASGSSAGSARRAKSCPPRAAAPPRPRAPRPEAPRGPTGLSRLPPAPGSPGSGAPSTVPEVLALLERPDAVPPPAGSGSAAAAWVVSSDDDDPPAAAAGTAAAAAMASGSTSQPSEESSGSPASSSGARSSRTRYSFFDELHTPPGSEVSPGMASGSAASPSTVSPEPPAAQGQPTSFFDLQHTQAGASFGSTLNANASHLPPAEGTPQAGASFGSCPNEGLSEQHPPPVEGSFQAGASFGSSPNEGHTSRAERFLSSSPGNSSSPDSLRPAG